MSKGIILYEGFFLGDDNRIEGSLKNQLYNQHITSEYMPKDPHPSLYGKQVTVEILGYGNNKNVEGYSVKLTSDDPDIQALINKIEKPCIPTSLSDIGEAQDAVKLSYYPMVHKQEKITATFGGYNGAFLMETYERPDQVYFEPRYSFHDTADNLYMQALNGNIKDVACLIRLKEILYQEEKYDQSRVIGYLRDASYEYKKYNDYNLNQIKVDYYAKGSGGFENKEIKDRDNVFLSVLYEPKSNSVLFTIKDLNNHSSCTSSMDFNIFLNKSRKELDEIIDDLYFCNMEPDPLLEVESDNKEME